MDHATLKRRMLARLKEAFKGLVESGPDFDFDAESAIYWYAADHHAGQNDALYGILSTSEFRPGRSHRSVKDEGEIPAMMYETLEREFGPKRVRSMKFRNPPGKRRLPSRSEVEVVTWSERDRNHIWVRDKKTQQKTIAEWWDDDARQMFEDGFFIRGLGFERSVLDYAESVGLLAPSGSVRRNPGGAVRKNIFLFNNPGNAQRVLAENFVKGANSGVASSMYIHGNRIYSYGPHFPIAERHVVTSVGALAGTPVIITSKKAPSRTTATQIGAVKAAAQAAGLEIMYQDLPAEAKGPAAYSNPSGGVRKNIFVFNNGQRPLNSMEQAAHSVGLVFGTWAPGDGQTRYRFFVRKGSERHGDYNQGDGIYTALGRKDAMAFISAYGKGRSARTNPKGSPAYVIEGFTHQGRRGQTKRYSAFRSPSIEKARARAEQIFQETGVVVAITQRNPLTRSEAGHLLRHAKADITEAGAARRFGLTYEQKYAAGHARGIGFAVQETGGKAARKAWIAMHTTLDRVLRNPPVCENPIIRGDKLPSHLKAEVLRKFIYRWTTENQRRESSWSGISGKPRIPLISDAQWLREHAFHVTKDGRLSLRHHHAEPYYMADDWKKGDPKPNPLTLEESREIEHLARRERIVGEQIQSPGSRGYHIGRAEGMRDIRSRYGRVRANPLIQTVMLANPGRRSGHTAGGFQIGDLVNVLDGSGVYSGSIAHVVAPFDWRQESGAYKPVPRGWVHLKLFSGRGGKSGEFFTMPANRLRLTGKSNPALSSVWNRLTHAQRQELLEISGVDRDAASVMAMATWTGLRPRTQSLLEMGWHDPSRRMSGETTRRIPVGARNPLTRREAGQVLRDARFDVRHGSTFQGGHTRSSRAGMAFGKAKVVRQYGPRVARRAANRISDEARKVARTTMSNPGLRLPAPGTKMTVAQALELARRIGNKDLIRQCQEAIKLQGKANAGAKTVTWKHLPMGSKTQVEAVVALVHYGDSPETMYKPPKGSKKGNHMYRHTWSEGKRTKKPVPVLVAPGGKAMVQVMNSGQKISDWMRG